MVRFIDLDSPETKQTADWVSEVAVGGFWVMKRNTRSHAERACVVSSGTFEKHSDTIRTGSGKSDERSGFPIANEQINHRRKT
jgi:hypothetical protein